MDFNKIFLRKCTNNFQSSPESCLGSGSGSVTLVSVLWLLRAAAGCALLVSAVSSQAASASPTRSPEWCR